MKRAARQDPRPYAVERIQDGQTICHVQVVYCACPGCSATYRKRCHKEAPFPVVVIAKMAHRDGWTVDRKGRKSYCPAHAH